MNRIAIVLTFIGLLHHELAVAQDANEIEMVLVEEGNYKVNDRISIPIDSFKMSKYEITQVQWNYVMNSNPSHFNTCESCPVEQVSWNEVQEFIRKLNLLEGENYRLPSHPEWIYVLRGAERRTGLINYKSSVELKSIAWCAENGENRTHIVGKKLPNELGLYDMNGNVWEWVSDVWPDDYDSSIRSKYQREDDKSDRIIIGGGWTTSIEEYYLIWFSPQFSPKNYKASNIGFRLAKSLD